MRGGNGSCIYMYHGGSLDSSSAVDAAAAASKADKRECDVLAHGTERLCASGWVFGVYAVRDGRKALVCRARCQGGHLVCPFVCVHCTLV